MLHKTSGHTNMAVQRGRTAKISEITLDTIGTGIGEKEAASR